MEIMDKRILKKIAKDWAKGILYSTGTDSFDDDSLLDIDEQQYVVEQVQNIALKIAKGNIETNLDDIVAKYYIEE